MGGVSAAKPGLVLIISFLESWSNRIETLEGVTIAFCHVVSRYLGITKIVYGLLNDWSSCTLIQKIWM